jgi:hypothetical protein
MESFNYHFWIYWTDFKLEEDFAELVIRVFLEIGLGSFQTFLILKIWDKPEVKRFQTHFLKLASKPKKPRILWFSYNTLMSLSEATHLGHFQCFWKIYWELSQEPDVLGKIEKQIRTRRTARIVDFLQKIIFFLIYLLGSLISKENVSKI